MSSASRSPRGAPSPSAWTAFASAAAFTDAVTAVAQIDADTDPECVVAADRDGVVVGAGYPRNDDDTRWEILAQDGATGAFAVIDGELRPLTPQ